MQRGVRELLAAADGYYAAGESGIAALESGSRLAVRAASKVPGAGVLQVVQLRRDGGGLLPGAVDPRLADCGFRVAGGESFVQAVRQRW